MIFGDQSNRPLAQATVVRVPSPINHVGIIAYDDLGQQIVLHNSKKRGYAAATSPDEFNDGNLQVVIDRPPASSVEGAEIVQRAWSDVQRGVRWSWFNNCQDFVNRAVQGRNGSPTRDLVFGLCALGVVAFAVFAE